MGGGRDILEIQYRHYGGPTEEFRNEPIPYNHAVATHGFQTFANNHPPPPTQQQRPQPHCYPFIADAVHQEDVGTTDKVPMENDDGSFGDPLPGTVLAPPVEKKENTDLSTELLMYPSSDAATTEQLLFQNLCQQLTSEYKPMKPLE